MYSICIPTCATRLQTGMMPMHTGMVSTHKGIGAVMVHNVSVEITSTKRLHKSLQTSRLYNLFPLFCYHTAACPGRLAYIHMDKHTYTHIYIHTRRVPLVVCKHAHCDGLKPCLAAPLPSCCPTHIHAYTHIYTHIHAYTHIFTHPCIQ